MDWLFWGALQHTLISKAIWLFENVHAPIKSHFVQNTTSHYFDPELTFWHKTLLQREFALQRAPTQLIVMNDLLEASLPESRPMYSQYQMTLAMSNWLSGTLIDHHQCCLGWSLTEESEFFHSAPHKAQLASLHWALQWLHPASHRLHLRRKVFWRVCHKPWSCKCCNSKQSLLYDTNSYIHSHVSFWAFRHQWESKLPLTIAEDSSTHDHCVTHRPFGLHGDFTWQLELPSELIKPFILPICCP